MITILKWLLLPVIVLLALVFAAMSTVTGQNFLLSRAADAMAAQVPPVPDALRVYVCGSAAPLPAPGRAQGCIAVLTPDHYLVIDVGAGSANNLGLAQLPTEQLDGVLLTHFHSDHIADLPSLNVQAWAAGHEGPLRVYGPPGVATVVEGFNLALSHDRIYRSVHHGQEFMPEAYGVMQAVEQPVDSQWQLGELTITSFAADHDPIDPAVSYRFDYKGRSVVVTGDTVVTEQLAAQTAGIDLLLSDALSLPIVETLQRGMAAGGRDRLAKILGDIQTYHAHTADVAALHEQSKIGMTALYHLVPAPRNRVMENIFKRDLTDSIVLTQDRMWFELPVGSDDIEVRRP